jgi:hypothetical protein
VATTFLADFICLSLELLRKFYSEGLVDNTTFLAWLVQQMGTCNLAQAGFVSRLADNYLDGMLGSRALTRPLAEACLVKLLEVKDTHYFYRFSTYLWCAYVDTVIYSWGVSP